MPVALNFLGGRDRMYRMCCLRAGATFVVVGVVEEMYICRMDDRVVLFWKVPSLSATGTAFNMQMESTLS